ncbi:hypothetical protein [Paenibacillus oceani]|nr:hypothetical protein [Paenibacillus oceani]
MNAKGAPEQVNVNKDGLNLFGSGFGDHPQDIVLSFVCSSDR